MQKKVKESLYFDWLPGPFKSATFFSLFVQQFKTNEEKNKDSVMYQRFYLFISLFSKYNVVLTSKIEDNF